MGTDEMKEACVVSTAGTSETSSECGGSEMKTLTSLQRRSTVDLEFRDVSYTVRCGWKMERLQILKSVSGRFKSGQLSAILGCSGAGKTSLMDILSGYRSLGASGDIFMNGQPRNTKQFHKLSCYIMQEDMHQPNMTVEELLAIAANLKLGDELTSQERRNVVNEMLKKLGLMSCRRTMTDKLSGGEKKRLSIALEFVNNPPIVFVDEPTSGLDSVASSQCIHMLQTLASQGRNIICTIHQPSASLFYMFSHVYFLARGRCIYQGSPKQLVSFLGSMGIHCPTHHNPADVIIECIHGSNEANIQMLSSSVQNGKGCVTFNVSDNKLPRGKDISTKDSNVLCTFDEMNDSNRSSISYNSMDDLDFPTPFWKQFLILLHRFYLQMFRNKVGVYIQVISYTFCGVLCGLTAFGIGNDASQAITNVKLLLVNLIFVTFSHLMLTSVLFPMEMKMLKREYNNRWYSLKAFYMAYTVYKIPINIFLDMIFVSCTYFLSNQPLEVGRYCSFSLICILVAFSSEGLGWIIGSLLNSINAALVASVIHLPLLILALYGIDFNHLVNATWKVVMQLSFVRLGLVGLTNSIYEDREPMDCPEEHCIFKYPSFILKFMGLRGQDYWMQVIGLCLNIVFYRIISYAALRWRVGHSTHLYKNLFRGAS